jgi:hypothetical protein
MAAKPGPPASRPNPSATGGSSARPTTQSTRTQPNNRQQSLKEQRDAERAAKVEAFKKERARQQRNRAIGIWGGAGAGVLVLGALIAVVVVSSLPAGPITGLQTFTNVGTHVPTTVDYPQTPPAGGPHNATWLNCGIYNQEVPKENAVHALEHGAVWVTYDPTVLSAADVANLQAKLPTSYIIMSPFSGLDAPVVASAWNAQVKLDGVDDPRLTAFLKQFWRSASAPEPNGACSGTFDAPGKVA